MHIRSLIMVIVLCALTAAAWAQEQPEFGKGKWKLENICEGTSGETIQKAFYEDGGLDTKAYCKDGLFHGVVKKYAQDQTIILKANYENGKLNGHLKLYGDKGVPLYREKYNKGKRSARRRYDKKGKLDKGGPAQAEQQR